MAIFREPNQYGYQVDATDPLRGDKSLSEYSGDELRKMAGVGKIGVGEDKPTNTADVIFDNQLKYKFASGATSSEQAPAFWLLPLRPLLRLVKRYFGGAFKHGPFNWLKGAKQHDEAWVIDRYNHTVYHLYLWMREGCKKDDNLAAAAWGCMALMEAEEEGFDIEMLHKNHGM